MTSTSSSSSPTVLAAPTTTPAIMKDQERQQQLLQTLDTRDHDSDHMQYDNRDDYENAEGGGDVRLNRNNKNTTKVSEIEAIDDVCKGVVYASLAITDNSKRTLKKVSKANPWHEQALKLITGGSTSQAHASLETILSTTLELKLEKIINVQGLTPGGHFLDTQGYIATNDECIVLSYRCTTSAFDWLTNFNTTSSAWEIEEDAEQGFSGFCSGFSGWCCNADGYQPRVHTGFYNNFLGSMPDIQEHIIPLLAPDQPPRKLYVVGHSLGAGIATLAGVYFATEFDWNALPHTLINVTAGSPRACCTSMKDFMDTRLEELSPFKCRLYRVKCGRDVVANVPPKSLGFRHLVDSIKLDDDQIYWDKASRNKAAAAESRDRTVSQDDFNSLAVVVDNDNNKNNNKSRGGIDNGNNEDSKYQRFVSKVPKSLRDHMPDFYLKPLMKARGIRAGEDLCKAPCIRECNDGTKMYVVVDDNDDDMDGNHNNNNKNHDAEGEFVETGSESSDQKKPRRGLLRSLSPRKRRGKSWFSRFGGGRKKKESSADLA